MSLHWEAWHETLSLYDRTCSQDFLDTLRGVPTELMVIEINRVLGYSLDPIRFAEEKERRFMAQLYRAKPIQPVVDVALRFKDTLPMAVASGGERDSVLATLRSIGLGGFFDTILTAADAVKPKPAPDIFLEAAKRLQVAPQDCLVFEDGDAGIKAAKQGSMHVIDVRPIIN